MRISLLLGVLFLLSVSENVESARILAVLPSNMKSHTIVIEPLVEELAARRHEVTAVTCFPHSRALSNLTEVDISHRLESAVSGFSFEMINKFMPNSYQTPRYLIDLELNTCEKLLSDESIQKLIRSNEKYDLVLTEIFTVDCFVPLAHKFNSPLISITTGSAYPWVADRVGLPDNPSYIPNYFLDLPSEMNFFQRIYNSIFLIYTKLLHKYYTMPKTQTLIEKYFGKTYPYIEDMLRNTSLLFINSYFSMATSRPFPPNVVEIGGVHIRENANQLPQDLKIILEESSQGVILMSFGSLVKAASIPRDKINMFMKVFSKLPQRVILKYEEELPGAPPNVVIRKWLPQREIIEHKNVKAFLGHGGLASTIEAVYFGKPIIGIPLFSDQYLNLNAIARRGGGVLLDLHNLSENNIETAVKEILNNSSYSESMRRLSSQFRDRPQTPLQTAVYWTEYVIRHQGALHLRPASVSLPLYQYLLLDVIAVLMLSLPTIIYIIYVLFFKAVEVSPNDLKNYSLKKEN